jgi:hypothetical protein
VSATPRVAAEWQRRVEVEYRSAALTQHLTLWLIQAGLSPDLIRAGLAIVDDELAHAELAHEVAQAAGAEPRIIDRGALELVRTQDPLEHDLARVCAGMFCLGETVAVPIFRALRERCTVEPARHALDRVLADEVRHRDFGWTLLEALVGDRAMARLVERELPTLVASVRRTYTASEKLPLTDEERAWGLMPAADYAVILERTVEREFVPRFARLGITLGAAAAE